jgi:predicted HD phosphohydrolase
LSIYALLHDIGKPILRFARRYSLEKTKLGVVADRAKEAVESLFAEGIEAIASKGMMRYLNALPTTCSECL